ncbi:MAG: hypothetical protein KF803_02850 [Cyclobacteriaceae bacterium]|nr:hypothetical protein [Cyclobacteriaceae bacterium]
MLTLKVQSDKKIEALSNKLIEFEKIQKTKEEYEKQQKEKKFEAGKAAISSMKSGVKILNFTYDMLDLDQTIELTTNIWSDTTFRNTWNRIEDWGTVAGTLIAVGGALQSDNESDQIGGIAIGAGVIGCSKLLGTLLGINEKKLRKKMEKIDLSVRAYDDLNMRNKQLKTFIENNRDFEGRIKDFEVDYIKAANGDMSLYLTKLVDLLDEYKSILKQIPTYLDDISSVSVSYINNKEKYKELPMKKIFDVILTKCGKLKQDYNKEVKPLLDVSPEIKRLIFSTN